MRCAGRSNRGATAPRPTATGCTRMYKAPPAHKVTRHDRDKTQNLDSQFRLWIGGPVYFLAGTAEPALRFLRAVLPCAGDDLPAAGRADLHGRVSPSAAISTWAPADSGGPQRRPGGSQSGHGQ